MCSGDIRGEVAVSLTSVAAHAGWRMEPSPCYRPLWLPCDGPICETHNPVEIDWLSLNREFS